MQKFVSLLSLVGLLSAGSAYADIVTSPTKNSAFASLTAGPADSSISATLRKGKPRRVVKIDFSVTPTSGLVMASGFAEISAVVTVNGTMPEPDGTYVETCTKGGAAEGTCTLSGTMFVDLDVAEAGNPGQFRGQPIVVQLDYAVNPGEVGELYDVALAVLMVKK